MRITLAVLQATVAASAEAFVRTTSTGGTFASSSLRVQPSKTVMSLAADLPEFIQVKKLSEDAIMPVRGSEHAAGFDLASAHEATVPAGRQAVIKTDLSIAIPKNTYARIAPRSGLALKKMIDVGAGVVDYDYRGPVGVVLFNHGAENFTVKKGDRIAQLILERISMATLQEVRELPETTRGAGGFGSTGVEGRAVTEVVGATRGSKKLKVPELASRTGAESVKHMLGLVSEVASALGMDNTSEELWPLRKGAIADKRIMGEMLEGVLNNYHETKDKKALMTDVDIITESTHE